MGSRSSRCPSRLGFGNLNAGEPQNEKVAPCSVLAASSDSGPHMKPSDYFVHESSYVDDACSIGPGTKIWHFSHVMKNSRIGAHCNIGQNVVISSDVVIGNNVKI